jgi:hypothetical protein
MMRPRTSGSLTAESNSRCRRCTTAPGVYVGSNAPTQKL